MRESQTDTGEVDPDLRLASGPVRDRIVEYLGGHDLASATCAYLAKCDSPNPSLIERLPVAELGRLLQSEAAVARSLYDAASIIVHLDIEYVNHDSPAVAFEDPWHAFQMQEPVVAVIEELLSNWGIRPLHLLTGQGHHFVWRFPRDSNLERRIAHLVPSAYRDGSEQVFANLGLLMEYFAHLIQEKAGPNSKIPVEITAVQVLPGKSVERELIAIDISEYGDPLESRTIRTPFTRYLKPWSSGLARRMGLEGQIGPCICIPLHEMDYMQALKVRQDLDDVVSLARRCCMIIPEESEGMVPFLEEYQLSSLRSFHQRFYETDHDPPERWPDTYGRTPLWELPGCVRRILTEPNDLLLKPSGMRLVTRCLLAKNWHPRHIAGLVRSKFEDPAFGWGSCWDHYSPAFRADFYVRLFAGQIATGLDPLLDFHCDGLQAEGLCHPADTPCNLCEFRHALGLPESVSP